MDRHSCLLHVLSLTHLEDVNNAVVGNGNDGGREDGRDGEVDELDNLVQSPGQVDRGGSRCPKQTFCLFNVHTKSLNHMIYMAHTPR